MIHPADSESEEEEDNDKAVAVKDDPQFTIAVTRGVFLFSVLSYNSVVIILLWTFKAKFGIIFSFYISRKSNMPSHMMKFQCMFRILTPSYHIVDDIITQPSFLLMSHFMLYSVWFPKLNGFYIIITYWY